MEKRVLFTELDDRGSHLRKEITPTAVVTDKRRFPAGLFWDANKTYDVIVADATSASDTLEKAEKNLNNEIARATNAENALSNRIDDLLGIDALDIEDLKQIVEDLDPETGILSVIEQKADQEDLDLLRDDISVTQLDANGHDYIEIGGIKWATMNIGASSITDAGLFFLWGDTQGYTPSLIGSGEGLKYFSFADYKYTNDEGLTFTKYNIEDGKTVLDLSDDAANASWGGSWRMPTAEEWLALRDAVDVEWTNNYNSTGVAGLVCTDKIDSSKVLFLPTTGRYYNGTIHGSSMYWSSSLNYDPYNPESKKSARYVSFADFAKLWGSASWRDCGIAVRGVLGVTKTLGTTILDSERTAWNNKLDTQEQADWNEADNTKADYIKNKPTIPAAQVNSDWNAASGVALILNKPTLATVATTGSYTDLSSKPTIPSIWVGTQEQYDLIDPIDPSTIYIIK